MQIPQVKRQCLDQRDSQLYTTDSQQIASNSAPEHSMMPSFSLSSSSLQSSSIMLPQQLLPATSATPYHIQKNLSYATPLAYPTHNANPRQMVSNAQHALSSNTVLEGPTVDQQPRFNLPVSSTPISESLPASSGSTGVSSQPSLPPSIVSPPSLPDESPLFNYRPKLVSLYALESEIPQDPWPPVKKTQYINLALIRNCLLYTSPSPRDATLSRMPSSA